VTVKCNEHTPRYINAQKK